ncbi:MAG: serine/threonine protein kinase [Polyangiaceae bacterium]|nr:serine/threonine protein kinase [Polyangiaceae bacterium]
MLGGVSGETAEVEILGGGRYAVFGRLGRGAQAETLSAVDRREGRPVAVKRFRIRGAGSWKDVELAEREARVVARLKHPALPSYVDHFEEGGCLYLVTELVEGESLAVLRARGEGFDEPTVVRFLRDASEVLDYLHGTHPPVIHRDIKPGNVLRRANGSFAFVDFGAVRDSLRPEGGSTVVGTFGYMAPEQFQGRAAPATDVYAVGATALALLTGREPEELPHRGLAFDVRAALGPRANPQLIAALEQMLQPDPERRAARLAPLLRDLVAKGSPHRSRHAAADSTESSAANTASRRRRARGWAPEDEDWTPHRSARAFRRHLRHRRARHRGPPQALALIGLEILRWLLAVVFARWVPRALDAWNPSREADKIRARTQVAAAEHALTAALGRLEDRVRRDQTRIQGSDPSVPNAGRKRVSPIDVEGEEVTEEPPSANHADAEAWTPRSRSRRR